MITEVDFQGKELELKDHTDSVDGVSWTRSAAASDSDLKPADSDSEGTPGVRRASESSLSLSVPVYNLLVLVTQAEY